MNKPLLILNPAARSERAGALSERVAALPGAGRIHFTERPGEARDVARRAAAEGVETIVAAGGDGTVNEVANGIAGTPARLGILPVGTMNVFATELGIPHGKLEAAWEIVRGGRVRPLDFPVANGAHFVQLAGVGLDAEVVRRTAPESKKALGPLSYLVSLAQVAAEPREPFEILAEDSLPRRGRFVLVGNGRFYGGPFVLFPDAKPDDGKLDVLVFQNHSHWDLVRYFQAIAFGSHPALPDVEYFQTTGMDLRGAGGIPLELDGELAGELPCRFGFADFKLPVLVP